MMALALYIFMAVAASTLLYPMYQKFPLWKKALICVASPLLLGYVLVSWLCWRK